MKYDIKQNQQFFQIWNSEKKTRNNTNKVFTDWKQNWKTKEKQLNHVVQTNYLTYKNQSERETHENKWYTVATPISRQQSRHQR